MRRKDKEITDKKDLEEIFFNSQVCRIAFFDNDYPYIVPMNYGYKDNTLYMHCAPEGRKIDLIKANNRVGFEIDDSYKLIKDPNISCKWTSEFRSIVGFGRLNFITDHNEKIEALDILMRHHGSMENFYKPKVVDFITVLKLEIDGFTGKKS